MSITTIPITVIRDLPRIYFGTLGLKFDKTFPVLFKQNVVGPEGDPSKTDKTP